MTDLILQLILMSSLAVIVYLMAIAVPRIKDNEPASTGSKILGVVSLERMDAFLNSWKEKVLRRLRIYLLKAERLVGDQLRKSREIYKTELDKKRSIKRSLSFKRRKPKVTEEALTNLESGEKKT